MCFFLIIVFSVIPIIQTALKVTPNATFWDIPTGHCDPVCSCQMDGLYYSEGEQWAKPEDPCTIYKCYKNGFYEPVQKGCWYKQQCQVVNSTWSEGCSTFTCTESVDYVYYKLTEAGCAMPKGGCLPIGSRWEDGCDVIECQLDGECLKTKRVRTGCAVQGACKRVDSYWHDGCTVYMCANENSTAVARTLTNEQMQWPDGHYALLKPKTGCPSDVPEVWSHGARTHYGTGGNVYSKNLSLAGNYTKEFMGHEFCIHGTSTSNSSALPRYKTYWEPGSYCIFRRNGICPRGFSDGYVSFDDNVVKSKSVSSGELPDGDFTTNTGFYFCCRKDGVVLTEIVLPKDENFVLFMENGETECQTVRGMTHSVEFVTFDGRATSKPEKRGLTPSVKILNGDVTLSFCHYKPMECGCSDPSGEFIAVNTEKEINCIVKKCISENNMNVLKVMSGGCPLNGKCQPERSKWSVNHGETCRVNTCERVYAAGEATFEITEGFPGCRDGEVCKNVGEEIYRGCYTSRCTVDTTTNTTAFKVIKADCPWLDSCKAPNTTWEHNCMTYRCDMNVEGGHYQWNVQPITYACEWNNTCYKQDDVWTDGCIDYKCIVTREADAVNWSVKTVRLACKDLKGNCLAVGKEYTENCVTYRCNVKGEQIGLDAVSVGCVLNKKCYAENEIWNDTEKCVDYQCVKVVKPNGGGVMQVSAVGYGCMFNKTCMAVNSTWPDGCRTRKCEVIRTKKMIQRSIAPVSAGCDDKGICREVGYLKITDTCMHYSCIFNDTYKDSFFSLVGGSCKGADGQCHNVSQIWTEKQNNTCLTYVCQEKDIGYLSKMTEQKCKDANGNCQPVGASGFPAKVKGKLHQKCSCVATTTSQVTGIAIQCKG